jgi:uncharacterized protein (UPF0332 family)
VTGENVRALVADEVLLARSALRAAAALLDLGIAPDAASRIYYAAFHGGRALLYAEGIEPRSHRAVRTLLGQHFVRTGALPSHALKDLTQLEALRTSGDYDSGFSLGVDDLRTELEKAQRFVDAATAILTARGMTT